jgi:hypothetical protein
MWSRKSRDAEQTPHCLLDQPQLQPLLQSCRFDLLCFCIGNQTYISHLYVLDADYHLLHRYQSTM